MKNCSIIIVVLGLITVGVMVGLVISEDNISYTSALSAIAAISQAFIGGLTLIVAFGAYKSWQRQLLYPRYIDSMNSLYDEFYNIIQKTESYLYMEIEELESIVGELEPYYHHFKKYVAIINKNEFIIRRFAPESTVEFIMWDTVYDSVTMHVSRIYNAKKENDFQKAKSEYHNLLYYANEYRQYHDAGLP
ncbi:hypothetical protein HNP12_000986 [Aeromonas hydrophila]|uniref:hypothetical protein n=1 Tax=Aeromonas hydrophila TaxID=644 RepID=UPI002168474E|nr:hypothetical protein [Aeromonas hydrophila]MCS3766938.1 hypothetical protein [Aeromonas hydrophila]MCS3793085.1 hypothetical protein [Aeromonas hydrophila]